MIIIAQKLFPELINDIIFDKQIGFFWFGKYCIDIVKKGAVKITAVSVSAVIGFYNRLFAVHD